MFPLSLISGSTSAAKGLWFCFKKSKMRSFPLQNSQTSDERVWKDSGKLFRLRCSVELLERFMYQIPVLGESKLDKIFFL